MADFSSLRMLFAGDLNDYSKGYSRLCAAKELGVAVEEISTIPVATSETGYAEISNFFKLAWKLGFHLDLEKTNKRLIEAVRKQVPDIIWIEKGNMILPRTLKHLRQLCPNAQLVSYTDDDMYNSINRSWAYRFGVKLYDTIFTTKSYNADPGELPSFGAQKVIMVDKAYDPAHHMPVELTPEEHSWLDDDVGFIGSFEEPRAEDMLFLAKNGIRVRVWGNGWDGYDPKEPNLVIERRALVNTNNNPLYSKGICATKINLAFLRKANRDLQTDRSIEIPACGAFMMAEYSDEHAALFEEDKESVYFRSREELVEKIQYYLSHEEEREQIATAGRLRCLNDDYSQKGRVKYMLEALTASQGK
ncbi:MAG: hypothetical protein CMM52_06305 [Rhodospirillaceae bacterium]|nr:hypothetical protein [Rhodospirillaceae bacterium]|tara:strand:- start:10873 stop:11955 length:1083 start_codon:yes stop_codon:yes gene_type:complete